MTIGLIVFYCMLGLLVIFSALADETDFNYYIKKHEFRIANDIKQRILENIKNDTLYGIINNSCYITEHSTYIVKTKYDKSIFVELKCKKFIGDTVIYIHHENKPWTDEKMILDWQGCSEHHIGGCWNRYNYDSFEYIIKLPFYSDAINIPWYIRENTKIQ